MPPPLRVGPLHVARPDIFIRTHDVGDPGRAVRRETIVIPSITNIPATRIPILVQPRPPEIRITVPIGRFPVIRNPAALEVLGNAFTPDGKPRSSVTLPIAPDGAIDDTKRFEDPHDPAVFWYLPRYERKMRGSQFEMSLGARGNGWALLVKLVPSAAPEVTAAGGGTPIAHEVAVSLRYKRKFAKIETEDVISFTEITTENPPEGPVIVAVAPLDTLEKRDAAFIALTTPSAAPVLEIIRTVQLAQRVATPHRPLILRLPRPFPFPFLPMVELFEHHNFEGKSQRLLPGRIDVGELTIGNDTLSSLRVPAGWKVTVFSESNFWGDSRVYTADTQYVGDDFNDRASSVVIEAPPPPPPPPPAEPMYTEHSHAVPWRIEPFVVDKDLHPYVYGGIIPNSSQPEEPEAHSVEFEGKSYPYFQDPRERHRFYYLPDSFRLMRNPNAPRTPAMIVQLTPGEHESDESTATLKFVAVAFTRTARLDAAGSKLEQYLPNGETGLSLEPLAATNARFSLALPGGGVQYQSRPDAVVDMSTNTLTDLINLPFTQFSALFDAMFSAEALLFSGLVTIGPSDATHTIPFTGRLGDLHGQVIDTSYTAHAESGGVVLTLTNVIESPVKIGAIDVKLRYDTQLIDSVIADLTLPIEIASGANVQLVIKPATVPPAGAKPEPVLTLDQVTVALDREAVLDSILVTDVVPETKFAVRVKAHKVMFDASAADPLLSMVVHFENGGSVDLTDASLEGIVQVSTPITNLLLARVDARTYRYKLEVIRRSSRKRDTDWRSDNVEILYPDPS